MDLLKDGLGLILTGVAALLSGIVLLVCALFVIPYDVARRRLS